LIGEDCIDFSLTLKSVDRIAQIAIVEIDHVPPPQTCVNLPADWLKVPVSKVPNNWIQITKESDSSYLAAVGVETFSVIVNINLHDGRIISAKMENPVETIVRKCSKSDLSEVSCGAPSSEKIFRRVEIY
jgi:hypothetical protein